MQSHDQLTSTPSVSIDIPSTSADASTNFTADVSTDSRADAPTDLRDKRDEKNQRLQSVIDLVVAEADEFSDEIGGSQPLPRTPVPDDDPFDDEPITPDYPTSSKIIHNFLSKNA